MRTSGMIVSGEKIATRLCLSEASKCKYIKKADG